MSGRGARTLTTVRLAVALVFSSGRREFLAIIGATVITSIAVAGQLLVGRHLLDMLAGDDRVGAGELAPSLALLGALLMGAAISQAISAELRIILLEKVHRRAMDDILDVATESGLEAFEGADFHDRLQRALIAAGGQVGGVVFGIVNLVSTLVIAVGVVSVLASVAPVLVPVAVIGYVPIALVNFRNNRARYQLEVELTELQRDRIYLEDLMTSRDDAKEIRAYDLAPTTRGWHAALWDVRMDRLRHLVGRRLRLSTLGSFVTNLVLVATLSAALILAGRGSISIGDAAVAIVGLQQLSGRLQSAGAALNGVHEGVTFLRDFESFRASLPVIRSQRPTGIPPSPPETITVERLGYRYSGATNDAVRDVSFELRRGQIMAIVGANGSGKSTVAKLLCQLLPPTRGTIAWDGVDLAGCDPSLTRAQIAPVFQDYARYQLTIRQAIGLGDTRRLDDAAGIEQAAQLAGLGDLVNSQPQGIDTRLGKAFSGGVDISLGQWQRLAIARALFRDANVVVLDEPSASLDPKGEADLFDLLHTLCRDRLVIFVSHRFATVRSADVVMVLDQGETVEIGSHDELMAQSGLYAQMFTIQADRYGPGAPVT